MSTAVAIDEWVDGKGIDFESEEAKRDYQKRATRVKKAFKLQEPDRVPVILTGGLLAADYADLEFAEGMYDVEKMGEATKDFTFDLQPDNCPKNFTPLARMLDELDFNLIHWPGGQLDRDSPFQFVEKEYMKADEYDEFLTDPTGFFLRTYVPRIAEGLEGFATLPRIANPMFDSIIPAFGAPEALDALDTLRAGAKKGFEDQMTQAAYDQELMEAGYPDVMGGISEAPLDALSDTIRGTKGVMIDIRKRPEKVKEANDLFAKFMIEMGIGTAVQSGSPIVFIPLHKGSDAFLSKDDYREFYWTGLRDVLEGLMDHGLVPWIFAEGSYDNRLDILSGDQPDGDIIWHFDQTDMEDAKELLSDEACIAGNVPSSLLKTGSPDEVREYCEDLIASVGPDGFILTPGCTPNRAPRENLEAMIEVPKSA